MCCDDSKMKPVITIAIVLVVLSFLVGIYFYPQMPAEIDTHWNADGVADGQRSKFTGLFAIPIVSLILLVLFLVIPRIDPKKENIRKFRGHYDWLIFVIMAFMFYIYLLSVFWNLGAEFNFTLLLLPAFTLLFLFIGFVLEKAEPNWFVGIRTPWTLSSEKVWHKTHKLGAKLFKIAALITLFGFVFRSLAIWFVIAPIIVFVLYLIIYSYLEYLKEKH